jgi:hypothetical protein
MGIRDWINNHPKTAGSVAGVIVVVMIITIVVQVLANRRRFPSDFPQVYFTADDGKSWFAASASNIPPWDYQGQPAVAAYVFQCNGKRFVGYMERFSTKYHDAVVAHGFTAEAMRYGRELKRPGSNWVPSGDLRIEANIEDVKCPDGNATPEIVEP